MKLSYRCISCKKDNFIKTKASNRHDLLLELGKEEFNQRCKHCGNFTKKYINRLYAETNNLPIVIAFIAAVIGTIALWNFGWVSTLTGTIPSGVGMD